MSTPNGTAVRKIRLDVSAGSPNLRGLNATTEAVNRLSVALRNASKWSGTFQHSVTASAASGLNRMLGQAEQLQRRATRLAQMSAQAERQPAQSRWLTTGVRGLTPGGFGRNVLTAGGWMMAASLPLKAIQLGGYSYKRAEDLELQSRRLTQVFRGVGGTSKELTDDVLKLAAAEGRATDEAMQAAIQWSRLGLSRKQAAEATRVSLMGANVAEMTAAQTTEHLSAVSAAYSLNVSELNAALGMLNQTSNTYRVTNKDLLEGISRVSGVAQQAGMSLAELQGIIGATVQQTGQTGPNIANALKTVLVRLNREDTQKFFGERYGMSTSGSAADLRKLWQLYEGINEEQRRDILLKVGGATQASRLRSILESYPSAMKAAILAQQNLNSAEKENILITNSLAAARQRLASSWDRLANDPRGTNAFSGFFNGLAGDVSALGNIGRGAPNTSARYFDPSKASLAGTAMRIPVAGAHLWSMITSPVTGLAERFGMSDAQRQRWQYSYLNPNFLLSANQEMRSRLSGFSDTPMSAGDLFQQRMKGITELRYKANAAGDRASWLDSLSGAWGGMSGARRQDIVASLKGVVSKSAFAQLSGAGVDDARGIFSKEAENARQSQDRYGQAAARAAALEIARLEQLTQRTAEDQERLNELQRTMPDLIRAATREAEDFERTQARIIPFLESAKGLLGDVKGLIGGLGLSQANTELATLTAHSRALSGMLETPGLDEEVSSTLRSQKRVVDAQLTYRQSGAGRAMAAAETQMNVARRMAESEADNAGVGDSEGERLVEKKVFLEREMARMRGATRLDMSELLRLQTFSTSLLETQFRIQDRIRGVERDRRQLTLDINKEMGRSLIGSSPSQLLSKLAVNQLGKGGWNAGKFFSLSPEGQNDAWAQMGSGRMADLNRESSALSGQSRSVKGMQSLAANTDNLGGRIASAITERLSVAGQAAEVVGTNMDRAAVASATIRDNLLSVISSLNTAGGSSPMTLPSPMASPPANFSGGKK